MNSYDYPYDDFARDIDAVVIPLNAADHNYLQQAMRARRHLQATYPIEIDRVERGAVLMMSHEFHAASRGGV